MRRYGSLALLGLSIAALAAPQRARAEGEDGGPKVTVGGLVDLRYAHTDDTQGWLDGGLGKTRYGATPAGAGDLARLAQLSLLVDAELSEVLSARVQVNADAEPDPRGLHGALDLVEGFVSYRPEPSPSVRLRFRAGAFFPPVSLENVDPAWTSRYTITTSAINSWVGEELRTIGAEAELVLVSGQNQLSLGAAGYGSNDPAGTLLAWRGWALHDRQAGLAERVPLAPIPSISPGGAFAKNAEWVQPVAEIDGRLGYYALASLRRAGAFELHALYSDNPADETAFDGWQYAWDTRYTSLGLRVELPARVELLGQHLFGETYMGRVPATGLPGVDNAFQASYGMLSVAFGRHRVSARYDRFEVEDEDDLGARDDNRETGEAWTGAYLVDAGEHARFGLEVLHVDSERPVRAQLGLPAQAKETLLQASFRLAF